MAFHQPPQQARQAAIVLVPETPQIGTESCNIPSLHSDSVEWVLFSPPATSTRTQTVSGLADHVRLSDFASFDCGAQVESQVKEGEGSGNRWVEEDAEEDLESLDCHLHDFSVIPPTYETSRGISMRIPRHDGFGSFLHRVEDVHGQLLALDAGMPAMRGERRQEATRDSSKTRRIEAWRNDHSQTLLNEMERQSRRARRRKVSAEKGPSIYFPPTDPLDKLTAAEESEPFLERLTMRIIRDLLGIDEEMLSILFGESLPHEPTEVGLGSGTSSRNYWDIPGDSAASTGGPGAWAEA
ncbi:MAG: hypothetical protein M1829_005011 [Trizodia sp. TS-e1964]|nr:MAG: hypothetical protein M1829_005011 [Trizodia sp. TS-e1964]